MNKNKLESSSLQEEVSGQANDQAQLRAEEKLPKSTETAGGALAAAPCSVPFLASVDWSSPIGIFAIASIAFFLGSLWGTFLCALHVKKRLDEE